MCCRGQRSLGKARGRVYLLGRSWALSSVHLRLILVLLFMHKWGSGPLVINLLSQPGLLCFILNSSGLKWVPLWAEWLFHVGLRCSGEDSNSDCLTPSFCSFSQVLSNFGLKTLPSEIVIISPSIFKCLWDLNLVRVNLFLDFSLDQVGEAGSDWLDSYLLWP